MIRFKDKVFEEYFIDPETAVITDRDGNIQKTYIDEGRPMFKQMGVHRIQAHTAWGYKEGYHVHHIDENKMNNALSNLAYLPRSEHRRVHNIGKLYFQGKHHTDETKAKISASNTGKHHTDETKAKISTICKGYHWWNNGVETMYRRECPGDGWVIGRISCKYLKQ